MPGQELPERLDLVLGVVCVLVAGEKFHADGGNLSRFPSEAAALAGMRRVRTGCELPDIEMPFVAAGTVEKHGDRFGFAHADFLHRKVHLTGPTVVTPTMKTMLESTNPSIDLADLYDLYRPVLPYAFLGLVTAFFTFVAVFGG
jgi:hypothetical protein